MPVINRIADLADETGAWRRDLHAHPELLYELPYTADFVAEKLRGFGCDEVVTGIGRSGIVGLIRGQGEGRTIGLRADMDALPIVEATGLPHASATSGHMHACGHDGHSAMLLGAARYLAETRRFEGTAAVIFQPAEEGGAGAKAMLDDGLLKRFPIEEFYGMHNMPGIAAGTFAICAGPLFAATDRFRIHIEGKGGHAARPNLCVDPIFIGAQIIAAAQAIASRNVDPLDSVVVSVTQFHAGTAFNIIPQTADLAGTIRTLNAETRTFACARLVEIAEGTARLHGATATVVYESGYPVTINHAVQTDLAARVAGDVAGAQNVQTGIAPSMGAEDFSYMLEERPGAMILIGNGDTAGLHHPAYDFNDAIIGAGASYWARLVETAMPVRA